MTTQQIVMPSFTHDLAIRLGVPTGRVHLRGAAADRHADELSSLQRTFRDAMAGVATPVSVVSTVGSDGVPHGTTVSAFASLSLDPPMIMVALGRGSDLLVKMRGSRRFGMNLLAHDQAATALRFATKGDAKFDGVAWRLTDRLPRIDGVAGWVACRVESFIRGGDHVVVLGEVLSASATTMAPLTYYDRGFGTHRAHVE